MTKSGEPMKAPETPLSENLMLELAIERATRGAWTCSSVADAIVQVVMAEVTSLRRQLADQQTALAAMTRERNRLAQELDTRPTLVNPNQRAESALAARPTLPAEPPPPRDWEKEADELIRESRESEVMTAADMAVTINARPEPSQRAAAAPLPSAEAWQSIETAPKDGTPILVLADDNEQFVGCWKRGGWELFGAYARIYPIHKWQPLPAPPVVVASPDLKEKG